MSHGPWPPIRPETETEVPVINIHESARAIIERIQSFTYPNAGAAIQDVLDEQRQRDIDNMTIEMLALRFRPLFDWAHSFLGSPAVDEMLKVARALDAVQRVVEKDVPWYGKLLRRLIGRSRDLLDWEDDVHSAAMLWLTMWLSRLDTWAWHRFLTDSPYRWGDEEDEVAKISGEIGQSGHGMVRNGLRSVEDES